MQYMSWLPIGTKIGLNLICHLCLRNLPVLQVQFVFGFFTEFSNRNFDFSGSQFDVRRDMFLQELKNSNNKNRLLTDKMNGTTVFKIPDELWDRSYPMFCVELLGPNIKLECRPHGFTEEDVPVYTRTGKVANKLPYPEDIVRYEKKFPLFM